MLTANTTTIMTTSANNTSSSTTNTTSATIAAATSNTSSASQQQQDTNTTAATTAARAMQSDEDFNIRFVNLVRTHKCLYDKKVPEYRNRDNQEKAWSLISKETRESVIHCKERWRNLRACLSRYIKQQSCADPQHKPYYLTEHMAFLLPFLKSTRNSLDSNNGVNSSLATLFHLSQQQLQQAHATNSVLQAIPHLQFNDQKLEVKHSLSDNEDEETIDAFDPAVTASLQLQRCSMGNGLVHSPPLSDTASANTLQNFIPDVQLAELRTPDGTHGDTAYVTVSSHNHRGRRDSHDIAHEPKRIKTECHASEATTTASHLQLYSNENSDMEFFRSILPDIGALTPQQKRKFKIGILELIDDVAERYPERPPPATSSSTKQRRNSAREWRK